MKVYFAPGHHPAPMEGSISFPCAAMPHKHENNLCLDHDFRGECQCSCHPRSTTQEETAPLEETE